MHSQTPNQPLPNENTPPSRPDKHVLVTILQVCSLAFCELATDFNCSAAHDPPHPRGQQTLVSPTAHTHHRLRPHLHTTFRLRYPLLKLDLPLLHLSQLAPRGLSGRHHPPHLRTPLPHTGLTRRPVRVQPVCRGRRTGASEFIAEQVRRLRSCAFEARLGLYRGHGHGGVRERGGSVSGCSLVRSELTRLHCCQVSPIHTPDTLYISHTGVPSVPVVPGAPKGLAREIKSVHAVEHDLSSASAWFDMSWTREVSRFGQRMAQVGKGVSRAIWKAMTRRRGASYGDENESVNEDGKAVAVRAKPTEVQDVRDVYARFLLGQATLSDDDDDEFRLEEEGESDSQSESDEDGEGDSEVGEDADADISAPALYVDLARRSLPPRSRSSSPTATSSALTSVLIAHLTSPARSAPLTRRRYTQISGPDPHIAWLTHCRAATEAGARTNAIGADDDDPRRNCVVCTVEPRSVICWPCRCLALCDDCRSNLASRMGAGKHQCPCCRRSVEGYSRIFIP
jgi:hypothetical protein